MALPASCAGCGNFWLEHDLFRKPASTPDQVRGRLFRDHALRDHALMRPHVFVTQPIADSAVKRLRKFATVKVNPDASRIPTKRELIAGARQCDILFSRLHDKIDRDVLTANPKLRALTSMTITPDNIDLAAATELGI